jgi:outer membrane protein assembly factor BamA
VYNSQLWEYSLLRLNQLEYFDPLKVDQDSEAHQDPDNHTVELLLKVHEKGKNSIGMNGGVSGLSGAFIGLNYQTNNFLGLGETLSLQANLDPSAARSSSALPNPISATGPSTWVSRFSTRSRTLTPPRTTRLRLACR